VIPVPGKFREEAKLQRDLKRKEKHAARLAAKAFRRATRPKPQKEATA
jgi:hypothetical protein